MSDRPVTERDFRMPEFRDADPSDYEFRGDGKIVRKDRWETGIRRIASIVGIHNNLEIDDVVNKVKELRDFYDERTDSEEPSDLC